MAQRCSAMPGPIGPMAGLTWSPVSSRDAARRQAFRDRWDVRSGFGNLDACLKDQDGFDVASICTPTDTHEVVLTQLLDSPARIVFCEKPMTGDPAHSAALHKAYEAAGKAICVNYLRRWDSEMTTLRDELAAGDWGALRSVTAFYAKGLFHTGSHMLDLIQFLIGPLTPAAGTAPQRRLLARGPDHRCDADRSEGYPGLSDRQRQPGLRPVRSRESPARAVSSGSRIPAFVFGDDAPRIIACFPAAPIWTKARSPKPPSTGHCPVPSTTSTAQ